jgi:hypothetical protein
MVAGWSRCIPERECEWPQLQPDVSEHLAAGTGASAAVEPPPWQGGGAPYGQARAAPLVWRDGIGGMGLQPTGRSMVSSRTLKPEGRRRRVAPEGEPRAPASNEVLRAPTRWLA